MIEVKSNAVLRDGQQIAVIEDGVCRSYFPMPPVLKGQIKKATNNAALTFDVIKEQPPADPERRAIRDAITKANRKDPDWTEAIIAMLPDERARGWVDAKVAALGNSLSSSSAIYCEEFETVMLEAYDSIKKGETPPPAVEAAAELEAQPLPRTIADLHALAEKGTIPKPPATHEALGSRTPAFVQWVKAHLSPEDFEAAYRGRKLPTIEEVEHEFGKLSRMLLQQEEASKKIDGGIPI